MTYNYENGVLTITRDDGAIARFAYNPETQEPFANEDEALSYANGSKLYFVMPADAPTSIKLSPIEFELLFTIDELVLIDSSNDPKIKKFNKLVQDQKVANAYDPSRGLIDFGLPMVTGSIDYLVTCQEAILTEERAVAVKSATPPV